MIPVDERVAPQTGGTLMQLVRMIVVACVVIGGSVAQARTPSGAVMSVKSVATTVRSSMLSENIVFTQYVKGLMALRGYEKHVTQTYVQRLVKEANEVVKEPGNSWMPAHILLGVAVTETDLRWWLKRGYGTVADCGLTQINLPSVTGMSTYKKWKLCKMLCGKRKAPNGLTATKYSMRWTMKEMRKIKTKYCNATWLARIRKWHPRWTWRGKMTADQHFWRCMLSVYNQGPRFVTYKHNTCTFKRRFIEDPSQAYLNKEAAKCRNRNRYWLRAWCFAEGIRLSKAPRYAVKRWTRKGCKPTQKRGCFKIVRYKRASCRYAYSLAWIKARYQ